MLPLALFAVGVVIYALYAFFKTWQKIHFIQSTPTSKIRSAAQGYVEITGTVEQGEALLLSPLMNMPCVWWSYKIEEEQRSARSKNYNVIKSGTSHELFTINDSTGKCLVNPHQATITASTPSVWKSPNRHPILNEQGLLAKFVDAIITSKYRYTEQRLHVGETLFVTGEFHTISNARMPFDLDKAQGYVISEWKKDYAHLLGQFDVNGNGQLDDKEWRQVRLAAKLTAEDQQRQRLSEPDQHYIVCPENTNLPFTVSVFGQEKFLRRLKWKAAGAVFTAIVAAITALVFV